MGQSLVKNYIHLVFSTKRRAPLIHPPVEKELHAYLGGICKEIGCPVLAVGGYTDHVHILFLLSKKLALMDVVQKVKANSSKWMKTQAPELANFRWQNGYGAFSINYRKVDKVVHYIQNQHAHHGKKTFQDEYLRLLEEHQIDFDKLYVWD